MITPVRVHAPPRRDQSRERRRLAKFGPCRSVPRSCWATIASGWIDRSLQLTGQLNDSHVTALLELARKRQAEPIDLADDRKAEDEDE